MDDLIFGERPQNQLTPRSLHVCPAAVVGAPASVVWSLLADPTQFGWMDTIVERVQPPGPVHVGQTVVLRSSGFRARMTVEEVVAASGRLRLTVALPLGIVNAPTISCSPITETTCRVQYG